MAYLAGSTIAALRFARRPIALAAGRPPVSVLKPLHGADPGLYENLRSFIEQDYPEMQIVFGVRHGSDAALPVARELIGEYPEQDIALVVNPRATGSNLKVANLENMLPAAKHEILFIADSDMRVTATTLRRHRAAAGPRAGAVTCLAGCLADCVAPGRDAYQLCVSAKRAVGRDAWDGRRLLVCDDRAASLGVAVDRRIRPHPRRAGG
jgi:ceramide glucosyltransferase